MTKRELEKLLKQFGFQKHHGGRHDIWVKSGFPPIPVPRHHGNIPIGAVKSILKAAKIEVK